MREPCPPGDGQAVPGGGPGEWVGVENTDSQMPRKLRLPGAQALCVVKGPRGQRPGLGPPRCQGTWERHLGLVAAGRAVPSEQLLHCA